MNLRDQILQKVQLKQSVVVVAEWDDLQVTVRELSAGELEQINKIYNQKGTAAHQAAALELCVLDESGEQAFEPGDAAQLVAGSAPGVNVLYAKIMELSGIDLKKIKADDSQTKSEPTTG